LELVLALALAPRRVLVLAFQYLLHEAKKTE